jgi:hypothetical protein
MFHFCGRQDDQVKVRGMRVELGEINVAMRQCVGVREAHTVLQTPKTGGHPLVVAYAVPNNTFATPKTSALLHELRQHLPPHMIPAGVVFVPELPRLPNGKIDRLSLPRYEPGEREGRHPPSSPLEQMIADIWSELLEHPVMDRHDSFFELGGHSLLAGRMVNALRARGFTDLPIRLIFDAPILADFAEALTRRRTSRIQRFEEILTFVESLSEEQARSIISQRRPSPRKGKATGGSR